MSEVAASAAEFPPTPAVGYIPPLKVEPIMVTPDVMARWRDNPEAFALEALKFQPDDWQHEVFELLRTHPRVALRIALMACKGPGKSAILAVIVLWFIFTRPYTRVVVTSVTGKNLEDGLWSELHKWGAPLEGVFEFEKKRITHRKFPDRWFVSFRTWPKDANAQAQADSLAGVHEDYVMFVLDEVSEYPEGVVAAAEGALSTGKETILLAAGNCTKTIGSPLYRFATRDMFSESRPQGWHVFKITGDPDNPKRSKRVSEIWARDLIAMWGRDHSIVRTNVLAEFPLKGDNILISLEDMDKAMKRNPPEGAFAGSARVIGIDVARFGIDKTVMFPRQGIVAYQPQVYPYEDRNFFSQARSAIAMADRFEMDVGFVEVNGLGAGLWDAIQQLDGNMGRWVAVNVNSTEGINPKYHNLRAQMHFTTAEWLKVSGSLPDVPELIGEATAVGYDFAKQTGKIVITDKDEIKTLIGRSPDYWDALCIGHAYPVTSRKAREPQAQPGSQQARKWDYNPIGRRAA